MNAELPASLNFRMARSLPRPPAAASALGKAPAPAPEDGIVQMKSC